MKLGKVVETYNSDDETKKRRREKISSSFKRGNIGIANVYKKYRRQASDPGWLGHIPSR